MKYLIRTLLSLLVGSILFVACKKDEHTSLATPCPTYIYGVRNSNLISSTYTTHNIGTYDAGGAIFTNVATASVSFAAGAWNQGDDAYYATYDSVYLVSGVYYSAHHLCRADAAGMLTWYAAPDDTNYIRAMAYDAANNRMLAITNNSLAVLSTSSSTYTLTTLVSIPANTFGITVNPVDGTVYMCPMNGTPITRYIPGSGTTSTVTPGMAVFPSSLRFNTNDNMLYATATRDSSNLDTVKIVKIDPATGTTTQLISHHIASLPYGGSFYGCVAALDGCNNKYHMVAWLHAPGGPDSCTVLQYDVAPGTIQENTIYGQLNLIDIKY